MTKRRTKDVRTKDGEQDKGYEYRTNRRTKDVNRTESRTKD